MVKFLVERPVSVLMVYLAVVLLGLVSFWKIPVSLLPDIAIPEITIQLTVPDQSARQVEESYISRIRNGLRQVAHVQDVQTFATNGSGYLRLIFDHGTNLQYSFVEVNEKMDALMQQIPDGFERPRVIKASSTDIPVFYLTVGLKADNATASNSRFMELSEFAEQVIKRRIEQLTEVAMVDISGMEYPEIQIQADQAQLGALGLSPNDIRNILHQNNFTASNIKVRDGLYEFNVRYSSVLKNRNDIENLPVKAGNRIFQLSEIAKVVVTPRTGKGYTLDQQGKVITMAVIKKSSARMEDLKTKTNELMGALEKDYPQLRFAINRNQTALLDFSIANLKSSLLIGAILAFLVLFLFLKDIRSPVLIGISIPVSLIISLLAFYLLDISFNIISLSGLVVGVGLMIDNSIIVIDNIQQHIKAGTSGAESSARGVMEVFTPLLSSMLTTCAVFVPLIFIGGVAGALFYDQALSISIGLAASLVVSVTLIPVLYLVIPQWRFMREHQGAASLLSLENAYQRGYDWVVAHRWGVVLATLVLVLGGGWAYTHMPVERLPALEETEVVVDIDWNQNINLAENRKRLENLILHCESLVQTVSAEVGEQWYLMDESNTLTNTQARVYFQCASTDSFQLLTARLQKWFSVGFPRASYQFQPPASLFERIFGSSQAPVEVRLSTSGYPPYPDPERVSVLVNEIASETGRQPGRLPEVQEVFEIKPLFERILLYEVNPDHLLYTLRTSFHRFAVFDLRQGQFEVPVIIAETRSGSIQEILASTQVRSAKGALIPISQLVTVQKKVDYKNHSGDANHTYVGLPYELTSVESATFLNSVKTISTRYSDVLMDFSGSFFQTKALIAELWVIFFVALLLLYFIMASQFESLLQPLIVFIEIPIDVAGAVVFLWLFGQSFNLLALIGMIVMSGIVINDSILKIDTINRLRKSGLGIDEAIRQSGKKRLKAILMTSATTILAMIPFLWGSDMGSVLQRPFAVAIIGGMLIGTFVSLYFIPIAYKWLQPKTKTE